ncbi:hypothetical protein BDZ89DRAFT_311976 [Hymenopellis radicata]|nr:hypothetical protein BDZ89DRAFT_311976 [Hymenopellis radicata]
MSSSEQDVDDHDAGVVRTGPDTIRDLLEQEEPWTDLRKDLVQAVVQLDLDGASLDALTGSSARDTGLQPSRAFAGNVESKPFQSPVLSPSSQNIDAANEGTVTRYSLLEFPRHPVTDDLFEADPNEEVRSARGYRHLRLEGALLVGLIQRTLRGTGRVLLVVRKSPAALDARSRFDKPEDLMLSVGSVEYEAIQALLSYSFLCVYRLTPSGEKFRVEISFVSLH